MKNIIGFKRKDKSLNTLIIENEIIDGHLKLLSTFNTYFTTIGVRLAENIKSSVNPLSYVATILNSILIRFTEEEIINTIFK